MSLKKQNLSLKYQAEIKLFIESIYVSLVVFRGKASPGSLFENVKL